MNNWISSQVTESDAVDVAETAIKRHGSDLTTKAMAMIALLKLSSRFPSCSEYVNASANLFWWYEIPSECLLIDLFLPAFWLKDI